MRFTESLFVALLIAVGSSLALAQQWPVRPVTMVVGFAAGGGTDVLGRILGKHLTEILGQQVNIENVAGAGGMVGSARVAKAAPDGSQFVLGSRADTINQTLYKKPLYDLRNDLVPVILVADQPTVLVARKDLPVNSLQEFIAHARKNQSTMQFASAGIGSTGHVDCALLNAAMGVSITHVPYRGGGPALQDVMAGRVDYICTLSATAVPSIEGNRVKAIAILTADRAPMLPTLASAKEQGLPDFDASTWFGFFMPKGTPEAIIQRLQSATSTALDMKAVQEQLLTAGALVIAPARRSPDYMRKYVESEIIKNGTPLKAAGVQLD
jgi:tripartite-type tricarboxylate transporter receptor subunit TctC